MTTTKKRTSPPRVADDATDSDLPQGWVVERLGDICSKPQYGWTTSAEKHGHGVKLLRTTDISRGRVDWSTVPACKTPPDNIKKFKIHPGDIVVSRAGSVGVSHVVETECPEAVFASYLIRFRPLGGIASEFIHAFLNSPAYWRAVSEEAAGIALQNINASKLADMEIPVPPLAEQRRIIAALEGLLPRVRAVRERLARVRAILKRFRRAVLTAACSSGESIALREILESLTYGTATRCLPNSSCHPVLRIPNVVEGSIDKSDMKYAALEAREMQKLALQAGDLLMIRSNGSATIVGRMALVSKAEAGFAFAGYLMRLRFDVRRANPAFLNLALRAQEVRDQIELPLRSTSGVHNINSDEVRSLRICLPPLTGQAEIVRRVNALFALADAIEARVATAAARAERLTQSILARTFRGELVPQDPADEPAALLLDRIRAGRNVPEAAPPPSHIRRRASRSEGAGQRSSCSGKQSRPSRIHT